MKAIIVDAPGGADKLVLQDAEIGEPGPGEARIKHTAIGLNFIDVYFRNGSYQPPMGYPYTPGNEGAGVVEAVGEGVIHIKPGDRVAYVGPLGAYAEQRIIPADRLVIVPDGIDDQTAAAMMLKGMTVRYLLRQTYEATSDTVMLFHAAAGGVGLIAGQWAKALGATIIGTAGSDEKCAMARDAGYNHVINYQSEDFVARVKEITDGKGVDVVYDSIGQSTFEQSLDCLKPRGMMVSFGSASGAVEAFDLGMLAAKGSLYVTRPTLFTYIAAREDLEANANELFGMVTSGKVSIPVNQTYPLADARKAHEDLEARKTTGSTVILP